MVRVWHSSWHILGFLDSSACKESTCNKGDPSSISGLGRSIGEEKGYPLQYSWAFLVAQLVKNPPAVRESWVWSLGWEDPLEKRKAIHSSILAWRISTECMIHGVAKSRTWLSDFHFLHLSVHQLRIQIIRTEFQSQREREANGLESIQRQVARRVKGLEMPENEERWKELRVFIQKRRWHGTRGQ